MRARRGRLEEISGGRGVSCSRRERGGSCGGPGSGRRWHGRGRDRGRRGWRIQQTGLPRRGRAEPTTVTKVNLIQNMHITGAMLSQYYRRTK